MTLRLTFWKKYIDSYEVVGIFAVEPGEAAVAYHMTVPISYDRDIASGNYSIPLTVIVEVLEK